MTPETAQILIQLNQTFYAEIADSFADSRRTPQPGFHRLLEYFPTAVPRLLDVGCGEGRFGRFAREKRPLQKYVGVDFTTDLLAKASANTRGEFIQRDISRPGCLDGLGNFDIVVCLAAMQHIPGYAKRLRLLQELAAHLDANGRIFLSNWQFMDSPRQRRKVRDWSLVGLASNDVEPNDYLLTWQRDGFGLRYVCQIDVEETAVLAQAANLHIIDQFRSDGKEGDLSLYTILAAAK